MALDRLVPSVEAFRREVFGVRHAHHRADELGADFADLFSPDVLERLLGETGLRATSVRLVRSGEELSLSGSGVADSGDDPDSPRFVDTDWVRRAISRGHTLILRSLHRYHPPVRVFAHQLSAELGHPVRVNAFITPPNSRGVNPHYDVQDVFVLQIAGVKLWELRSPPLPDPLPSQAWFDLPERSREQLRELAAPLGELTLRPGDVLYFPRGTMHAPRTGDSLSVHLTVAVPKVSRHDLLRRLVDAAVSDPWFRASVSLPDLESAAEDPAGALREIAARLARVADQVEPEDLLWAAREDAFRELPPEPVPVLPPVTPPVAYRPRFGVRFRFTMDGEYVSVSAQRRRMRLPATAAPVIESLRQGEVLRVAGLVAELGEDQARELCQALVEFGLVVPVHDTGDVRGDVRGDVTRGAGEPTGPRDLG
ncbi:JmjC domain-containing protein [Streptoalloteichus hindustanus]|uniref:Cupin superfamily protein n=1 Tax=Streptoalloteichus hindustanus TaxID=2017 RepID=A0A1M5LAB7_STRHI|nr:cupin domain-containing protein [Streptoalloteichus hindustanus]SHG61967.1 Cupin superfamily protein [Streptoalloteichus hindustanus]